VGESGTILHYTGGAWQLFSSPTNAWLNAVTMVSPDEGWAVGDGGVILHYAGGLWGATISPAWFSLYDVAIPSPAAGWIVGADTILAPIPP
jgi:hypothetical protein